VLGDWVDEGAVFARVLDFDGSVLEEVRTPDAGVVLTVINSRALKAGGFAGKVGAIRP
jgi:predicted deacylase